MTFGKLMMATALGLSMAGGAALAAPAQNQSSQSQSSGGQVQPLGQQPTQAGKPSSQAAAAIEQARHELQQASQQLAEAARALRQVNDDAADTDTAAVREALDRLERAVAQLETHETNLEEPHRRALGDLRTGVDRSEQTFELDRQQAAQAFTQLADQARELSVKTGGRYQAAQGDPNNPVTGNQAGNDGKITETEKKIIGDAGESAHSLPGGARNDATGGAAARESATGGQDAAAGDTAASTDTTTSAGTQQQAATTADQPAEDRWYRTMRAEELIGKQVRNQDGDDISEIEDLVIDHDGEVYAILSVGGFLGIGDKDVVVPLSRMTMADDEVVLMTRQDEDALKAMPAYDPTRSDYTKAAADQVL